MSKYAKVRQLGAVVRNNFLKAALIPIFTVELILLCLFFFSANQMTEKNLELMQVSAYKTIVEISKNEARNFDDQLKEIRRSNLSLQAEHQTLFSRKPTNYPYDQQLFVEKVGYDLSRNLNPAGYSSLYLSSQTPLEPRIREKIIKTSEMDIRFKSLVDHNPSIVRAYFNSWDGMTRIYPSMSSFTDQFSDDFDMTQFNFYYLADENHNASKESVWTNVYLDAAGKGWMLSNLVPIYRNSFLEGITGLDVTLSTFSEHILSSDLGWNSGVLVVDNQGHVLTMSKAAEQYLSLKNKGGAADSKPFEPTAFNLLKQDTQLGRLFLAFFDETNPSMELTLMDEEYLVTKQAIPETGWHLLILTPLEQVYGPIIEERAEIIRLGLIFMVLAIIFYVLFFVYIRRSSNALAQRITQPIAQVTRMITSFESDDKTHQIHQPVNIVELDNLLSMNLKIQKAKQRYESISKQMKVKNEQLKVLAVTDQLTKLYNRLKLDEVLGYEVARSLRDQSPLAVALIDIDKFKQVNDTFGHQIGDAVLIGLAQIMQKHIRSTDVLGRWGGEEFMLILPNTSIAHAYEHMNRLRQRVEVADFSPVQQVTISVGLVSCTRFLCEKKLIELADNALYEAKENGRNRVELAPIVESTAQCDDVTHVAMLE